VFPIKLSNGIIFSSQCCLCNLHRNYT
jgi:hypothetical protein